MCSIKTMIKIMLAIGLLLVAGYVIFPDFQTRIAVAAPYLLVLACPLAMYFMMKGMNHPPKDKDRQPGQEDN